MKLSLSCVIFLSCAMSITPLFAGTQNLSTYYPAPQGNYLNMIVNGSLSLPTSAACSQTASPNVIMANNGGVLEICDSTGTYSLTNTSLWADDTSSGNNLYPANTQGPGGETVSIGQVNDPGGYTLNVFGTLGVSSQATIGDTQSTTLEVSGASTLAGVSMSSAGVSGDTSSGTLEVSGATTLNNGLTVNGAATNINNDLIVNGTLTIDNGLNIQLCTAAGVGCNPFGVAQSSTDKKYYATYAP